MYCVVVNGEPLLLAPTVRDAVAVCGFAPESSYAIELWGDPIAGDGWALHRLLLAPPFAAELARTGEHVEAVHFHRVTGRVLSIDVVAYE